MDVLKDLIERETPMNRLICGDVGFGKIEAALRAIFCVVSAGIQAMILAPTIVLAKQHIDVISKRFSKYSDVKVGLLSRFQTKSLKEEYLDMIKHGHLNIIVGTRLLLGNCVVYRNLGFLVVDEEQKEKIASFKTMVDILTLSATPIPRTLYLAFTGFHDASLISTHPPERVPIRAYLSAYSNEKVLSEIKSELDRGGQVFYVLPHIKGLDEVMEFLEKSLTDVEKTIAHGKGRFAALEECRDLGQGFNLAERHKAIRGFGNIFGEQQTGDVGNVGIDLFFEMLFESLSKVEEHSMMSVPYNLVELDIDVNPHLPSEYISYPENLMNVINEAEKAAEKDRNLMPWKYCWRSFM